MKMINLFILIPIISCNISSQEPIDNQQPVYSIDNQDYSEYSKAYFASGCFWCVETVYESLEGVKEVYSGYGGGSTVNPNYYQVMTGRTGHAESIEIIYDESIIEFEMLLKVFFDSHDPTTMNRQGADRGTQYRSIVMYHSKEQQKEAETYIEKLDNSGAYKQLVVTQVVELKEFYKAELSLQSCYMIC